MFWYPKYWATFGYILKNVTFEVKPNVANFYFNIWSHLPRLTWCLLISTNCTSKFNLRYRQLLLTSIRYNIVICTLRLNLVSLRRRRMPLEWFENVNRLWWMRQIRNLSKQFINQEKTNKQWSKDITQTYIKFFFSSKTK